MQSSEVRQSNQLDQDDDSSDIYNQEPLPGDNRAQHWEGLPLFQLLASHMCLFFKGKKKKTWKKKAFLAWFQQSFLKFQLSEYYLLTVEIEDGLAPPFGEDQNHQNSYSGTWIPHFKKAKIMIVHNVLTSFPVIQDGPCTNACSKDDPLWQHSQTIQMVM